MPSAETNKKAVKVTEKIAQSIGYERLVCWQATFAVTLANLHNQGHIDLDRDPLPYIVEVANYFHSHTGRPTKSTQSAARENFSRLDEVMNREDEFEYAVGIRPHEPEDTWMGGLDSLDPS
jgi:hypothetical protein